MAKKSLRRKKLLIYIFLFIVICTLATITVWYGYTQQIFQDRSSILSVCKGHLPGNTHHHTYLEIIQDGKKIPIPANIGLSGDCIHPVHTHDSTGIIHTDYPKPILFTLGDFFDTQGVIFNDKQIGALKAYDGYTITVKVEGKIIKNNYRSVVFKDLGHISIIITYHPS